MSSEVLSPQQFNTEQSMLRQGNEEDETVHRGVQTMSSNVYKPAFSNDLSTVRSSKSTASAAQPEEEEDD